MILNEMFYALLWILTGISRFCLASLSQKPGNLTCIFYYSDDPTDYTLNCSRTPTDESYSLSSSSNLIEKSCTSKNGSCSFRGVPYAIRFCLELKIEKETVSMNCINPEEILKPDPPQISEVKPIAGMKQMLRVIWERPQKTPEGSLQCQICYTATTKNHTSEKIFASSGEYNLTNLWDFTNYTIILRCTLSKSKVWSEWSSEKMGTTEEQAPLKVDLWRVIEPAQHTENRIVHLLWKECKEFPCSGIMNGYRVKYFAESNASFEYTKNTRGNDITLNLTKEAYVISVTALNEAGESPEATLRIPSIHEEKEMDHEKILSLNASALEEQMDLEWEPSDLEIKNYVIEWYYEPDSVKRSWQKVTNITKWTSPKGAFIRFKYYYILVYPLYKGEIKTPRSIRTYFHEGIPAEGPSAEDAENVGKNEATIKWTEIPEAKRNGHIIRYTVFYKAENGKEFGETVNSSVLQYRLKSLQADTKYTVHVMASTIVGGKNGTTTTFSTSKLSVVDIILINAVVGMFMLCLLIIGILGAVKRHVLKNALWPRIPHPHVTTTIFNKDQQPVPLRNSPSVDETHPVILEVQLCSKEHKELELLNSKDYLKETYDTIEVVPGSRGTLWNREHEASTSNLEPDCQNPTLPSVKGNSTCYENKEAQNQSGLKEETEFNPYLKNSVSTREFLASEQLDQNIKGTNMQPIPITSSLPNSITQPYVALNTFQFFTKH